MSAPLHSIRTRQRPDSCSSNRGPGMRGYSVFSILPNGLTGPKALAARLVGARSRPVMLSSYVETSLSFLGLGDPLQRVVRSQTPVCRGTGIHRRQRTCGLVGLNPSRGRISGGPDRQDPWFGLSRPFVLCRTVRDMAAALDVFSGSEPGDHSSSFSRLVLIWRSFHNPQVVCGSGLVGRSGA